MWSIVDALRGDLGLDGGTGSTAPTAGPGTTLTEA